MAETTTTTSTSKPAARRGWSGMIAEVTAAQDLQTFNQGILDLQCKIVAAEYGALWIKQGDDLKLLDTWPAKMAQNGQLESSPVWELLHQAGRGGFERQVSHVLKVEPEGGNDPPGVGAHVFVTALRVRDQVVAVTTVVADCRDPSVIQSTVPMRELAAGLYELFFVRQEKVELQKQTERVRSAMSLLAVAQDAEGFNGACMNLVNELARQLKCTRVSLGWIKRRSVALVAMSDTEDLKRHSEQVALIELSMSECLDQEQPVVCPPPPDAEPMLADAILHAHRRVLDAASNRHILSIPLRIQDEWLGVLTLERTDQPFDSDLVTHLQLVADVVSPQLQDRKLTDLWLVGHAWNSIKKAASFITGPKYVGYKLLAIGVIALLFFVALGTWSYKVSADCVLEIESKRIVSTPLESDLVEVFVEPGQEVKANQILAKLNDVELRLRYADANASYKRADSERQQASGEQKIPEMQQALARMQQAKAQMDLLQYQIDQSDIRSPINGVILTGDWRDKVGGVIPKGERMFEIAQVSDVVAKLRVSESDIDQIQDYVAKHSKMPSGRLATRSQPEIKFDFVIDKIIPLAGPHNNVNVFEVRARLDHLEPWLRPGMEGLAHIDVGDEPIYWIVGHRVADAVRLWLWW